VLARLRARGLSDDPSVSEDARFCRAIQPVHLHPPNTITAGQDFSSGALKYAELSVYLIDEWSIVEMQEQFPDCRLAAFPVAAARAAGYVVIRVPDEKGNAAHASVLRADNPGHRATSGNVMQLKRTAGG
jgi:hypothetical protein